MPSPAKACPRAAHPPCPQPPLLDKAGLVHCLQRVAATPQQAHSPRFRCPLGVGSPAGAPDSGAEPDSTIRQRFSRIPIVFLHGPRQAARPSGAAGAKARHPNGRSEHRAMAKDARETSQSPPQAPRPGFIRRPRRGKSRPQRSCAVRKASRRGLHLGCAPRQRPSRSMICCLHPNNRRRPRVGTPKQHLLVKRGV